jgi:geranylgeranyl pyrophosphate synthase
VGTSYTSSWLDDPSIRLFLSEQLRVVGHIVLSEIQARDFPPDFASHITQTLYQPGKLLNQPVMQGALLDARDLRGWSLPVLLTAASASGASVSSLASLAPAFWQRACTVAAASEYLGAALDLIDDIQDGDSSFVEQLGIPFALNTGIALLELASVALQQAQTMGWPEALAHAALEALHTGMLTSLSGQFLDLHYEQLHTIDESQVMEMTEKKSGTLMALICRLGALAGLASEGEEAFRYSVAMGLFGWHVGTWFQLLNDLHDAELAQHQPAKSDRQRHKKTLPLLLEQRGMIDAINGSAQGQPMSVQAALSYTYVVAETFRLRAQKALQVVEDQFWPHPLLWPLTFPVWAEP